MTNGVIDTSGHIFPEIYIDRGDTGRKENLPPASATPGMYFEFRIFSRIFEEEKNFPRIMGATG
jgi:hypothetical protein